MAYLATEGWVNLTLVSRQQVAEAARYVETQQKTGNVLLTVNGSQAAST